MLVLIENLILFYFIYVVSYTTFFFLAVWFYKRPEACIPHSRHEFPGFCIQDVIFAAIPAEYYSLRLVHAFLSLPVLSVRMFSMLFRMKGANKKFIHTPHGV